MGSELDGVLKIGENTTSVENEPRSPKAAFSMEAYEPPRRVRRVGGLSTMKHDTRTLSGVNSKPGDSSYVGDPLTDPSHQIRLLCLYAGDTGSKVEGEFITVALQESLKYEALSYAWGTQPAIHPVEINGKSMLVPPNPFAALQYVRQKDRDIFIWIDAICIDQQNLNERSRQVSLLWQVYRNASRVVAWLGESDSDSDVAMDFIPKLLDPEFLIRDDWAQDYGSVALGQLLDREWFRRAWVIQEVALAKEVVLLCGDKEVHFLDFVDAVSLVKSKLDTIRASLRTKFPHGRYISSLNAFRYSGATKLIEILRHGFLKSVDQSVILGRRMSLETLVSDLVGFQTTDPRDMIYALLLVAGDAASPLETEEPGTEIRGLPPKLYPDYSLSVVEVFSSFTEFCIASSRSLDIICRPWAPLNRPSKFNAPFNVASETWIPSWIPTREDLPFGDPKNRSIWRQNGDSFVGSARKRAYDAHHGTPVRVRFVCYQRGESSSRSMIAHGIAIGEIQELSTRMAEGVVTPECLEMIGGIYRDVMGTLTDISDSTWHTLCAGRDEKGDPAPSIYRVALAYLLQRSLKTGPIDPGDLLSNPQPSFVEEFLGRMQAVTWNRRVFLATNLIAEEDKLMGLAPRRAQVGDRVSILYGCSVPVILRPHAEASSTYWELIGEAYVDGHMDGEALCESIQQFQDSRMAEFEIR